MRRVCPGLRERLPRQTLVQWDVELAGWEEPCFRANTPQAGYQMKKVQFLQGVQGHNTCPALSPELQLVGTSCTLVTPKTVPRALASFVLLLVFFCSCFSLWMECPSLLLSLWCLVYLSRSVSNSISSQKPPTHSPA